MRSPKLGRDRSEDWYRYYAGYAPGFVDDALVNLELEPGAAVLDPWNGSGTTTVVAHERGFAPIGFDANPALVVIARARLLGPEVVESLDALAADVLEHARSLGSEKLVDEEPLERWLEAGTAQYVRRIECAVQHVLVDHDHYCRLTDVGSLARVSALAAFFYVALFESLRSELRPFVGSNPTWVKVPGADDRLTFETNGFDDRFVAAVHRLAERVGSRNACGTSDPTVAVQAGNSTKLPLADASVDGAVTSPPYCTRIDYVVGTRPELAVLGLSEEDLHALRLEMVGTPTIWRDTPPSCDAWGPTAVALLAAIERHSSHASRTYYRKYFTQYLDSLWRSLGELRRVLKPSGRAVVVVQDSYYKELRIDLAAIVSEMASACGWSDVRQTDFAIAKTKAAINPRARSWRSNFAATESVLLLA